MIKIIVVFDRITSIIYDTASTVHLELIEAIVTEGISDNIDVIRGPSYNEC